MIKISFISLFAAAGLVAQAATISATVPQFSYTTGDSVPLSVSVSNVTGLYAYQFDLSFDPTIVSAESVTESGYFASNGVSFSPGTIDNTGGTVSFIADSLSGPSPGFTGAALLATVDFTAIGPGTASLSLINITLLDSNLSDIEANSAAASVAVSDAPITGSPEPGSLGLLISGVTAGLLVLSRRCFRSRSALEY